LHSHSLLPMATLMFVYKAQRCISDQSNITITSTMAYRANTSTVRASLNDALLKEQAKYN